MGKWGKRIGYGIGDLGCNLVFSTMASYLMVFYTDVFGITAAAAGTMMLVTKFIDALTDTGMGLIVDRTHTRWGQGRPYFLFGAVPFALFTFLTFYIPDSGNTGKLIWAYVTYCLLCTAYTVVNIPLNMIVPKLTSDIHERNCLVSTRMVCAMLGTAVVMSITAPLVEFFGKGNEAKGYLITMTIYGILAMFIFFITFAIQPDVIDYSEYKKHASISGLIAAFQGFFVKGGMGVTSAVIGYILKAGGYVANAEQTPRALQYIELSFIWISIFLCIAIAAIMYLYKLDDLRGEMNVVLERRRKDFEEGC